jgi:putative endonuclease
MKQSFVYIMASKKDGVLYTGVTANLVKRIYEHKHDVTRGFTHDYSVKRLVYYEVHSEIEQAIIREKQIKKWRRQWKIELIENMNPYWNDLYADVA